MATIKVGDAMPDWGWFEDFYDYSSLQLVSTETTTATYGDAAGAQIVLTGTNLSYDGEDIVGGKITKVTFLDENGGTLVLVTNGDYKAEKLGNSLMNGGLWEFVSALTAGNDKVFGSDVGSNLNFGDDSGDDVISAGPGGSFIGGSKGDDVLKGATGDGWDMLSYEETYWRGDDKQGIKLDVTKGTVLDSWGDKDKISNFEEYRGSVYKDEMIGSKAREVFAGMAGNDSIDGGKGWDTLRYYRDANYEGGESGIVVNFTKGTVRDGFGDTDKIENIEGVYGTYVDDRFTGGSKDDFFNGISGTDRYDGKGGEDTVSFYFWDDIGQTGVTADLTLSSDQVTDDGFGNTETLVSIENIEGSGLDDFITLGESGGRVWAQDGNDTITGALSGVCFLTGDGGEDTFVFVSADAIGMKEVDHDIIEDFTNGEDKIDLSAIGDLTFIGTDAFGATGSGELRYKQTNDGTFVLGDTDGDGDDDFAIEFRGDADFTAEDFIL